MNKKYRQSAGAIVFNHKKELLLGNRIDSQTASWQFPQGGIEFGESNEIASKRELEEEMSLCNVKLVYTDTNPLYYDFSEEIKNLFKLENKHTDGQAITFTLFFYDGDNTDININTAIPEFKSFKWGTFDDVIGTCVDFKKEMYIKTKEKFSALIDEFVETIS